MATAVLGFISWFSGLGALAQGLIKLGLGLVINAVVAKLNKQRPDYKELQQQFWQSYAVARGTAEVRLQVRAACRLPS